MGWAGRRAYADMGFKAGEWIGGQTIYCRAEITYSVETSVNLQTWVTDGVSLSELAPDNTRIATVDRLAPVRFLRLVVITQHHPASPSITPHQPNSKETAMTTNLFARLRNSALILLIYCCSIGLLPAEQFGLFTYRVIGGAEVEITGYPTTEVGAVAIPAEIDGKPVTSIGNPAFFSCGWLTSVTIPASVISIWDWAFDGCSGLTSIIVEGGNPSYSSLGGVLFNQSATRLIQCPEGLTGSYAIPASVTSIGDYAFSGCSGLTSVTIPASVTSIGDGAFDGCSGLTVLTIPASVTSIGDGAFAGCRGLTSISVDDANPSYRSLDGVLFNKSVTRLIRYPGGLTGVYTIPASVTSIGDW
ncbi:MAG: leucine-rich repeat domain-containing protein, partial [Verrucomicrobia bacterium]|nr:leucine-rich repeat domain-containing protein [Verrucomicrobiota bacterium]